MKRPDDEQIDKAIRQFRCALTVANMKEHYVKTVVVRNETWMHVLISANIDANRQAGSLKSGDYIVVESNLYKVLNVQYA